MRSCIIFFAIVCVSTLAETRWVSPDFLVTFSSSDNYGLRKRPDDCREHIQKAICLVDPAPQGDMGSDRPCLKGGEAYAIHFQVLFDQYPEVVQQMFCSLSKIYVEKKFFGTAYVRVFVEQGDIKKAVMGMRKSVLDEKLDLHTWASWKEQLSFGGIKDSYSLTPGLPQIQTLSPQGVNDFLYFVVAHEFGHLFDFKNELNKFASKQCYEQWQQDPTVECEFDEQSWGYLTWATDKRPRPENNFYNRPFLCFYLCDGSQIDISKIPRLYNEMFDESGFISTYASIGYGDDFADTLAYYLMNKYLGTSYFLDTGQGVIYDVMDKLNSSNFKPKFDYIEAFLDSTSIIYP